MTDVQATGESIQIRISSLFLFLWVTLALLDPVPDLADQNQFRSMRIRIQNTVNIIYLQPSLHTNRIDNKKFDESRLLLY